jgi:hypothetical protein
VAKQRTADRLMRLAMPEESFRRLEKMQKEAQAENITDVLKDAIRLYEALLQESTAGSIFFIRRPGQEIAPYEIFADDQAN